MPRIEVTGFVASAPARIPIEAWGLIQRRARIPVENGDPNQNFEVLFRLSNKSRLTITQRPVESTDAPINQHP